MACKRYTKGQSEHERVIRWHVRDIQKANQNTKQNKTEDYQELNLFLTVTLNV